MPQGKNSLPPFIPEEKITEIRQTADIVDVIREVVILKRAGKDLVGLCPFHSEKTPSFTVSPGKQMFYCFGCGVGGSVFDFIRQFESKSFPEAVRTLAERYGISLPDRRMNPEEQLRLRQREALLAVTKEAAMFFRQALRSGGKGEQARLYLQQRGITEEISETFMLGFAPDGWDNLLRHLRSRRYPEKLIAEAGLVAPRKQGSGFYDRFRNRVIFPITNLRGQVIAFGGRVLDDNVPKYLNSPEIDLFSKRRTLYGVREARQACREIGNVFVVEGYMDAITLHQFGIANAVATLGTALTADHVRQLKSIARRAVLLFDSDQAGIRAARRSVDLFLSAEAEARILILPDGHDPDSFLRAYGAEAFTAEAKRTQSMVAFMTDQAIEAHGLSVEGKVRIVADLVPVLSKIVDPMARSLYVREVSERIGVDEGAINKKMQLQRAADQRSPGTPRRETNFLRRADAPSAGRRHCSSAEGEKKWYGLEKQIIGMMLQFPEILEEIEQRKLIDLFASGALKSIGEKILHNKSFSGDGVSDQMHKFDENNEHQIVAELAIRDDQWSREKCLTLIKRFESGRKRAKEELIRQIQIAELQHDFERVNALQEQLIELTHLRQSLDRAR